MNRQVTQRIPKSQSIKLHVIRPDNESSRKSSDRLAFHTKDGIQIIELTEITHIHAESNYSMIHLIGGSRFLVSKPLKSCQVRLEKKSFIRTHQSYLVNEMYVVGLKNHPSPSIVLHDGNVIPVSRRHHSEVKNYFLNKYSI